MLGDILGAVGGIASMFDSSGDDATAMQAHQNNLARAEMRKQYEQMREDLAPYMEAGRTGLFGDVDGGGLINYMREGFGAVPMLQEFGQAGTQALAGQMALSGLAGPEAQAEAIGAIESSPEFASMVQQGEEAMMQNASATGGLRGGNMQSALMEYRPQVLTDLINRQYSRLGGLSSGGANVLQNLMSAGQSAATNLGSFGQAAAAGVGAGATNLGANLAANFQDTGAAMAGGIDTMRQQRASGIGSITEGLTGIAGDATRLRDVGTNIKNYFGGLF